MSKKAKAIKKAKRQTEKRSRRAANNAQYAAWRDQGINHRSFRAKKQVKRGARSRRRVRSLMLTQIPANTIHGVLTQRQARNQLNFKQFAKRF
jgi:hypothetical protein